MDKPLHQYLRDFRVAGGVDQKKLAEALGIDVTVLSAYENGRRKVPADLAGKYIDKVREIALQHAKNVDAL